MTTPPVSARDALLERVIAWFVQHGVVDTSMRTLAAGIGTSNRMLNYHFGAREDLLAAVIEHVCRAEEAALRTVMAAAADPVTAGVRYWEHAVVTARTFAPLFFELSAHAMYGKAYADRLRQVVTRTWVEAYAEGYARVVPRPEALRLAHLSLAVGRGLLFELALTGDRAAAEASIGVFAEMVRAAVDRTSGPLTPSRRAEQAPT